MDRRKLPSPRRGPLDGRGEDDIISCASVGFIAPIAEVLGLSLLFSEYLSQSSNVGSAWGDFRASLSFLTFTAGVLSKDGDETGDELLARFFRRDIGDGFLALSSRLSHINRSFGDVSASSSGEPVGFTKSFQLSRGLGVT